MDSKDIYIQTILRYLVSSGQTFIAGFIIGIVPVLNTITVDDLGSGVLQGTLTGLLAVGVRGGIKAVTEVLMGRLASKS